MYINPITGNEYKSRTYKDYLVHCVTWPEIQESARIQTGVS